ncbi:DNA-3-methyladenine glycosylase [Mesoterricola sediminis]|uniref:Putative 3-methyladenine DNA glycosylase n=1 Tax=Mesoterricola sediminis TaxID=2927980 RepID=A0AA48H982_9BACT|nr:DNA-3-methyladenine glycosylase [Mesoterricola sediminis]BDU78253.1 putative 3-methyladenine DNA glycosylase [Mesoterricola sediminis]
MARPPFQPGDRLPLAFYLRAVTAVARDLLGRHLRLGEVELRITETEAYGGPRDTASHARSGPTPRNRVMWEEGGRVYVYFCYGMHHMLNVISGPEGRAEGVLIRSCEPVAGLERIRERRGGLQGPALLTGPGKVAQALGLDLAWTRHRLYEAGGLELLAGTPPRRVRTGPRVGVDFADPADRDRPWRFADADSPWVSHPRTLGR